MVAIVLMTLSAWTFIGVKMMNMKMDMNMKIIETEQQITDMDMQKHDSDHRETDMNHDNENDNDNSNDNNNSNSNRILRSDIMNARKAYGAREVWLDLIRVGKQTMKARAQANTTNDKSQKLHVMEIGVHSVEQCLEAAKESFHSHCFEPSPLSFDRIRQQLKEKLELPLQVQVQAPVHEHEQVNNDDIMKHLHLYNVAAGDTSGISLEFLHMGGTGDHIGEFDMWNMKAGPMPSDFPDDKKGEIIHVPSVRIDDVILPVGHQGQNQGQNKYQAVRPDSNVDGGPKGEVQIIDEVFAMKVDTQGFEFKVFEGMKESIKQHKIQYLLFEYWPKAMDLIAGAIDKSSSINSSGGVSDGDNGAAGLDRCEVAVNMLDMLVDAGYKLYALPLISHPSIVNSWEKFRILKKAPGRPLHDFREHCLFLRDGMEEQLMKLSSNDTGGDSDGGCQMGVWTDVLAVAPHVELFTPSAPKDL